MKKLLWIASVSIFGILNGYSQDKGDIELGGGVGVSLSNVFTADGQGMASSLTSISASASGEYYFSDRWGIKTKLIYDNKGWSDGFLADEIEFLVITDFELSYLTIPIMANWHFGSNRNWYLNFGPYAGLLLNAEASELGLDVKDSFKSTDFGLALGIGYKFEISDRMKLYIEYDGQSGFTDVFENNPGDAVRNSRSSLNLGILFKL